MATTSLWGVKGSLGKVVIYVENPDKTENPEFYNSNDLPGEDKQSLSDVIEYAISDQKTKRENSIASETEPIESYVTGVMCSKETARSEMMAVKEQFNKKYGIVAFHGYQSFAEGEVSPTLAHEIGVKLARNLWGDRFQVIVATHLDKANHIHNHFVLNSVSKVDGKKFNMCKKTYREMRDASDTLCREYGLSVIENPEYGKTMHHAEWKAASEGKPTWRSLIKADVDEAIKLSLSDKQFYYNLRKKGYLIKVGKDISVKPEGRERFFRLERNLGDEYSKTAIFDRILSQMTARANSKPKLIPVIGLKRKKLKKIGGLYGLYLHYQFKLGVIPKKKKTSHAQIHFLLKEDLIKLDQITKETRFIASKSIETTAQLSAYKSNLILQKKVLLSEKRNLSKECNSSNDNQKVKSELAIINNELKKVRKEIKLCDSINQRSISMRSKLSTVNESEKGKEVKNIVQQR